MTSRQPEYRTRRATLEEIAFSSTSASINSILPRRLLVSPLASRTREAAQRAADVPAAIIGLGRGLVFGARQVPRLATSLETVLDTARVLLRKIDAVSVHAAATVHGVDAVFADAAARVQNLQELELRIDRLIERCEPVVDAVAAVDPESVRIAQDLLVQLQPLVTAVCAIDLDASVQVAEVLSRSGPLLDQIDATLLPLLGELHEAVPDVRGILPVVQRLEPVMVDFDTRIAGLPGGARMRRRGKVALADAQSGTEADSEAQGESGPASVDTSDRAGDEQA